jgi:hypothetical protein
LYKVSWEYIQSSIQPGSSMVSKHDQQGPIGQFPKAFAALPSSMKKVKKIIFQVRLVCLVFKDAGNFKFVD